MHDHRANHEGRIDGGGVVSAVLIVRVAGRNRGALIECPGESEAEAVVELRVHRSGGSLLKGRSAVEIGPFMGTAYSTSAFRGRRYKKSP